MNNMKLEYIMAGGLCLILLGFPGMSLARVHVDIGIPPINVTIGTPPPLVISAPPEVEVIPGTYVYFAPGFGVDLFFYDGLWYREFEGRWFSCASYDGPWAFIASPPAVLVSLPADFRVIAAAGPRIPYWQLRSNWRAWHRDNYWARRTFWANHEGYRGRAVAPGFRGDEREHGVAPRYGGRVERPMNGGGVGRQYGHATPFRGGERPNMMNRGGMERQHGVAPSFGNRGGGGSHQAGRPRPNMSHGGMGRREGR